MSKLSRSSLLTLGALLSLGQLAAAQSFNINTTADGSAPWSTFGAAAAQPGHWNAADYGVVTPLFDLNGSATAARVSYVGCCPHYTTHPCLSGDDVTLMGSMLQSATSLSVHFTDLLDGDYTVYTYAMAPHVWYALADVTVIGSLDPTQAVGGDLCAGHLQGVSYARHDVSVVGGTLDIISQVNHGLAIVNGVQLVYGGAWPITVYCTAKQNSLGCTPAIGHSGKPSLTDPNPFDVNATNVINNKPGILFYGYSRAAIPFQGAWLCVLPPVKRTPPQPSGGNPPPDDCSGVYHYDMNARIQSGIDPGLALGVPVQSQYWSRDPQDPHTTNLTDAVEFTIQP